jgi:hypothetical protein
MTNETQSMAAIVTRIERSIQRVTMAIAPLSPAQLIAPSLAGERSIKDLLAHLTWWDQWLLVTLPADQDAPAEPISLPLADQIPPSGQWAEAMNANVHGYYQTQDLAAIQSAFITTWPRLVQRVARLSHDDLYDPNGMSAQIGQPVAPLILGIYEHYEEHAHELEQLRWSFP